jgi:class 3 adenylate cyclase/tetratricopeptide (TPR) repeat protein
MDIEPWLRGLGLERYVPAFRDNDIDAEVLPKLTADDLIGLGVTSIGHRRKLLDAIATFAAEGPATSATAVPLDAPASVGAERRQLTVMFCDLAGSTALSSRLDPEDLREVLSAYHKAVAEVVAGFGGCVAKYMGDGVLVYFGYPRAHEDDAERAVRAGLTLVERIGRLEGGPGALASRIGIATGLVVVGDLVGTGEAQERGVVGETPNLAARLQEKAPANGVIIAEATRRLVGNLFEYRDLGASEIKGLESPVAVWQVLRPGIVGSRFEALRSSSLSPLVGRDAEMELLLRRWERAKEGEGQIVLISGEPGIGKSRLIAALQERLSSEPQIRLRYFCSLYHRDSALHPFIAQLEHAAGFAREDEPAAKVDRLAQLVSRSHDNAPETANLLADLLELPTEASLPTDPRHKRELTFSALVGQLEGLARQQPVLFIFEDAQWADQTSLELLERMAQRGANLPLLMVVTFRPEFEPPWTGQAQVTSLTLSRLGQRDTATLVKGLTEGKALPAEITNRIIERTDGIPLFIEELTKTLLEGGLLQEEDDRYILAGSLPPLAIPASLHDSLLARLDRLAPVKEVAQIGAAIGREFSFDLLSAVARRPESQLREALDQLLDAGLIFRRGALPEASFVFKHALVQDAAYGALLRGRRQELHAAIATALEQQSAGPSDHNISVGERAGLFAYHWLNAEDWEKALGYTLKAADQAKSIYARPEAINHYWQALELLDRLPAYAERNRVHAEVVLSLISLPGCMPDEAAQVRMLRHIGRALENATLDGDAAVAVRLQAAQGYSWDDEVLLLDALARAELSGDASALAHAEFRYGGYLGKHGRFEESLGHTARAVDLFGAQGNRFQQAIAMTYGGRCYGCRAGRLDEALVYARRAYEAGVALDDMLLRALRSMEAEPHMYKGDWNAVVQVAEEALPAAWEIREWDAVLCSSAWLAIAYLKLRKPQNAKRVLDRVFEEVPLRAFSAAGVAGSVHGVAFSKIALAQLQLAVGEVVQALSAANMALEFAEQYRLGLEQGATHRVLGEVYQAMGKRAEADAAFRRSLDVLEGIQSPPELAQTLLAYGRFQRGDNELQDRAMIERALSLFEEMNATGWIVEARAVLAAA